MEKKFCDLFKDYDGLDQHSPAEMKRKRGLDFERLINDVMRDEKISLSGGYYTEGQIEQIDGAVNIQGRTFLLEVKWVANELAASELYAFIGKVENKFIGTLGIFISRNPLGDNFISSLNIGRRQSVIVIHGEDMEHVFSADFNFREYIIRAMQVLSIDHTLHFPVKDFLTYKKAIPAEIPTSPQGNNGREFIDTYILGDKVNELQMLTAIAALPVKVANLIFENLIKVYHKLRPNVGTYLKNFDKVKNAELFLEHFKADAPTLEAQTAFYFKVLLWDYFDIYCREPFISVLTPQLAVKYSEIGQDFETKLLAQLPKIYGSFDQENAITNLLERIWEKISVTTKQVLYKFYLNIYISDRKDKYPQKQFAKELVNGVNRIPREVINEWIEEKIEDFKQIFEQITEYNIINFTRTYWPVARSIYEENTWQAHVRQCLQQANI